MSYTLTVYGYASLDARPTAKTDLVYNGSAQELVNAGAASNGTLEYKVGENGTYGTAIPTATDAGTYTVYYKVVGDAYYDDVAEDRLQVTIAKGTPAVTAPTAKEGLIYTGEAQELITAGEATGGEMLYSLDDTNYSEDIPTATDAGTYYICYKVEAGDNYDGWGPERIEVTIAKADATVTAPTGNTLSYTGQAQALVSGGSATGGTLEYSTDGQTYSTTVPTGTDVGEYTVYYRVTGDANHNDVAAATVKATIGKSQSTVETAPKAIEGLKYNGQAQALITAGTAKNGEMQYSSDGKTYSSAIPTATNAGQYDVWYKVVGSTGYGDVEAQKLTVTIAKADATVTAPTGNTLSYTGQAQALVSGGSATGGTLEYSTDGKTYSTTVPTGTDVGEYTVYYRVTGDANHNDVAAATVKATIGKSQSTVETAPKAIANLTYNGQPQALITAGTAKNGEMQYSSDGKTYSTAIPTATNAGSYDVWYKVVGSTGYSDVEAQKLTVTIAKANATVTAPTGNTLSYTGQAQALVSGGSATGGTLEYSTDGQTYSTPVPTGTDVGEYTVYYRVTGDANHNDVAAATVKATIGKSQSTVETAPKAIEGLKYNGQPQALITAGTAKNGEMQYSSDGKTYSSAIPTATNAGSYDVWYKVVGSTGYSDVEAQKLTVTIAKADATVSFDVVSLTVKMGEPFTAPKAVCSVKDLQLIYSSDAPQVATVDAQTGAVTLVRPGITVITASIVDTDNYNAASARYSLIVEEPVAIVPLTEDKDYSLSVPSLYVNTDGTDKDLSNTVINDILFTLKNQNSPEGDGFDESQGAIVLNTVQNSSLVDAVVGAGTEVGSELYASLFTGLTLMVPAEEDGVLEITSQQEAGYVMNVKVDNEKPVGISNQEMATSQIRTQKIVQDEEKARYVRIWNAGVDPSHLAPTRGKKSMGTIKVTKVSYKAVASGIQAVGQDAASGDARWYDLNGRRIEQPTKKGLYILNGRKVVVH